MKLFKTKELTFGALGLLLASALIYFVGSNQSLVNNKHTKSARVRSQYAILSSNSNDENIQINRTFDEECKVSGEWEMLGRNIFIKRSGVFYFTDANLLHILLISESDVNFTYEIELSLFNKAMNGDYDFIQNFTLNPVNVTPIWAIGEYNFTTVSAEFHFANLEVSAQELKARAMRIVVKELIRKTRTELYLDVKIKSITNEYSRKKSAMICNKGVHLTKDKDYASFRWWVELNKEIGYEKIVISNHSIEDHVNFHDIFEQNKDFIELATFKCIPNLQDHKHLANFTYLKKYEDLCYDKNNYAVLKFELINVLILNECYLNHIDRYKYVAVVDVDETILPKLASNFFTMNESSQYIIRLSDQPSKNDVFMDIKCNRYETGMNVEEKTPLVAFLTDLSHRTAMQRPLSMHFHHGFYIHSGMAAKIMDSINKTLSNHVKRMIINSSRSINYTFTTTDLNSTNENVTFTFTIKSEQDVLYASRLLYTYHNVLKKYVTEFNGVFNESAGNYARFFYIGGEASSFACGKTIHDTRATFDLTIHYVENYLNLTSKQRPVIEHDRSKYWLMINYISSEYGHSSHFRRNYGYLSNHFKPMPIQELQLDLNYLNCYFKPVLQRIRTSTAKKL